MIIERCYVCEEEPTLMFHSLKDVKYFLNNKENFKIFQNLINSKSEDFKLHWNVTYNDGDNMSDFDCITDAINYCKIRQKDIDIKEKEIKFNGIHIYTSYYENINNLPLDVIPISIAGIAHNNFKGIQFKKLAPRLAMFNEWKKNKDNTFYEINYIQYLNERFKKEDLLIELLTLSKGKDICLICYEQPGEFCHRHLVANWLNELFLEKKFKISEFINLTVLNENEILIKNEKLTKDDILEGVQVAVQENNLDLSTLEIEEITNEVWYDLQDGVQILPCDLINEYLN